MEKHYGLEQEASLLEKGVIVWRRRMLLLVAFIGVALSFTGAWYWGDLAGDSLFRSPSVMVVLICGVGVALAGFSGFASIRGVAVELSVGMDGIGVRKSSGEWLMVRWDRPGLRLGIVDWRSIPQGLRDQKQRGIDFVLSSGLPLAVPLPTPALLSILEDARAHGFSVVGWSDHPSSPGPARDIEIRGPERHSKRASR